eukprot:SAG11_NODE_18564_length_487_cov_1.046392_2_plen_73_part_01
MPSHTHTHYFPAVSAGGTKVSGSLNLGILDQYCTALQYYIVQGWPRNKARLTFSNSDNFLELKYFYLNFEQAE